MDCCDIRDAAPSHLTVDTLGLKSGQRGGEEREEAGNLGVSVCVSVSVCVGGSVFLRLTRGHPGAGAYVLYVSGKWLRLGPPLNLFMSRVRSIISNNPTPTAGGFRWGVCEGEWLLQPAQQG